ncbi:o-succinylbenzoate synthase [Rarobacter incanus]|uniref:o-succinylbenzoate synthase n=1 Tax=Rarobacter incanus TaxID=153494 RepID=A0A542SQY2_9MICO|nr:o-succinylbenzoate synthase [Rarobacter incanus]TQK77004.1 O-succinylbenzoate synthase [Rarobacter incanus]
MADLVPWVYQTALITRFRGLRQRDGILLRGDAGWGEFSPFWDYDDNESAPWLRSALEMAHTEAPAPVRSRIPVNVTVPAVGAQRAAQIVRGGRGCTTAKVKVAAAGDTEAAEVSRLEAVRDALGPGGRIRIDANGGWSPQVAIRRIPVLDRAAGGLEYVEQPCPTVEDLAYVRKHVDVPIAADESIRRAEDPLRVVREHAADIAVLKVQPLGGIRSALRIAEQIKIPVVVSSALESSIGIAAGVALAAALPELPFACGLATTLLFAHDPVAKSLVPTQGALDVAAALDIQRGGPTGEPAAGPRADRWRERLHRVGKLVE